MNSIRNLRSRLFYGWVIAFVAFMSLFVAAGPRGAFGNLIEPLSRDFGWNLEQISLAASLSIFLLGLSQPLVGWLINRLGPKKVILGGLIVYGLSSLLLSLISSLWQLYLLYGVAMGISWGASSNLSFAALISSWFSKRRGLALSMAHSGMAIGQFLLIPVSMGFIIYQGWRWAVAILSFLVLGVGVPLVWRLVRDTPYEKGVLPDGGKIAVSPATLPGGAGQPGHSVRPKGVGLRAAARTSPFWLLAGSFTICGLTSHLMSVHFVPSAIHQGYPPMTAAQAAGVMWGANVIGIWVSGFISDYVGRKVPLAILYALRGLGIIMLLSSGSELTLYLAAILIGVGTLGTAPLTTGLVADIYGVASIGTVLGIVSMGHQLGGGVSIYLAGLIAHERGSYYWAFVPSAIFLFMASLACLFIREKRPKEG